MSQKKVDVTEIGFYQKKIRSEKKLPSEKMF